MTHASLFGHLVGRFAVQPENLATEALGYVLRRSPGARQALASFLTHAGMPVPQELAYQNQVAGTDQGQPDLVGIDADGHQRLIGEAKFWAHLTDHQPVTYIERLPRDGGVLLFIAPAQRTAALWGELLHRCREAGLLPDGAAATTLGVHHTPLTEGRHLALVSWRALIDALTRGADALGDSATVGDLEQLTGLCDAMDSTAYIPITSADLTSPLYRRVIDFADLADDIVTALVAQGQADVKNINRQHFKCISGRYFRLRGNGLYIGCDIAKWTTLAPTPIWLTFGQGWPLTHDIRTALAPLQATTPPQAFAPDPNLITLPLRVPTLQTREVVLHALVDQVLAIADRLPAVAPTPIGGVRAPA